MKKDLIKIGLIYGATICFTWLLSTIYYQNKELKQVYKNSIEAKKAVIELYKENYNLIEMLASMNNYADSLENEINHIKNIDKVVKDLSRH